MSEEKVTALIMGVNEKFIALFFLDRIHILNRTPEFPPDLNFGEFIDFHRKNQKDDSIDPLEEIYEVEKSPAGLYEVDVVGDEELIAHVNVVARDFHHFPQIFRLSYNGKRAVMTDSIWSMELGTLSDSNLFEEQKKERGTFYMCQVKFSFQFGQIMLPVMSGNQRLEDAWDADRKIITNLEKVLVNIGKESDEDLLTCHLYTPWVQQNYAQDVLTGDGYQRGPDTEQPKRIGVIVYAHHVVQLGQVTMKVWSRESGLLRIVNSYQKHHDEQLGSVIRFKTVIDKAVLSATTIFPHREQRQKRIVQEGKFDIAQFLVRIQFPGQLVDTFTHTDELFGEIAVTVKTLYEVPTRERISRLAGKTIATWVFYNEKFDRFEAASIEEEKDEPVGQVEHSSPW